jgi:hypothetical protein
VPESWVGRHTMSATAFLFMVPENSAPLAVLFRDTSDAELCFGYVLCRIAVLPHGIPG